MSEELHTYPTECGKTVRVNRSGAMFVARIDGVKASFFGRSASKSLARALAWLRTKAGDSHESV